ncbi:MAG: DUF3311 domain-containing protein [Alphaproteobacteria bacterium]|nr:DUF3311 domain-containing protein [Alphaproteobacteria bacterium]
MKKNARRFRPVHLLLAVPYLAVLWPPLYNHVEPSIAGVPFFYWYQMGCVALGALVLLPVYLADERAFREDE